MDLPQSSASQAPVIPTLVPQTQSYVGSAPPPKKVNKRNIVAIALILLFIVGTGAGAILIGNPITYFSQAWDCGKYVFSVTKEGVVTAKNGSTRSEPFQRARVYVNNVLTNTLDVPALSAGASATLGVVTTPNNTFTWQVQGTSDCQNSGRYDVTSTSYQCQNIKIYTIDDIALTTSDLPKLKANDKIKIVAKGTGNATSYKAAQFTINGSIQTETTKKITSTGDYYQDYTIPASTTSFEIKAKIKGSDDVWY